MIQSFAQIMFNVENGKIPRSFGAIGDLTKPIFSEDRTIHTGTVGNDS